MTGQDNHGVSDDRLVAYIDNELSPDERAVVARALERDPELRDRLEFLDSGGRPFGQAFDLLLDAAPDARLQAMFAGLIDGATESPRPPSGEDETVVPFRRPSPSPVSRNIWQLAAAASIALTVFGGGVITGAILGRDTQQVATGDQATRNWMDAVAQYVSLFSEQTLAGMPADRAARDANLRRVSTALGIDLSQEKLALPSLAFQGTQLLQLQGKPLAQIAFKSASGKPVAICIIKTPKAAEPPSAERRHGLNIVHWVANGYGYMVIGDVPEDALQRISQEAMQRLS
jgi:anti-sigma factor RsiW